MGAILPLPLLFKLIPFDAKGQTIIFKIKYFFLLPAGQRIFHIRKDTFGMKSHLGQLKATHR